MGKNGLITGTGQKNRRKGSKNNGGELKDSRNLLEELPLATYRTLGKINKIRSHLPLEQSNSPL